MSTHLEAMNAARPKKRSTRLPVSRADFVAEIASRSASRTPYCVSDLRRRTSLSEEREELIER